MIKSPLPPKKEVCPSALQKQVICKSDHKAAKIFVKGPGFSKHGGLQLQ